MTGEYSRPPMRRPPYGHGGSPPEQSTPPFEQKIVGETCIINLPGSDNTITIPTEIPRISQTESVRQAATLLRILEKSRIKKRPTPKKLLEQPVNPLTSEKYLLQAVNPPKSLRDGSVLEEAKNQQEQRVKHLLENVSTGQGLEINVGPLLSVKAADLLLQSGDNHPDLAEHLFLSRAIELADTLSGYPNGVTVNISFGNEANWMFQGLLADRDISTAQQQYIARMTELATQLGSHINPNVNLSIKQNIDNPELIERYEDMYQTLSSFIETWFPQIAEFAQQQHRRLYGENSDGMNDFLIEKVYKAVPSLYRAGLRSFTHDYVYRTQPGDVLGNLESRSRKKYTLPGTDVELKSDEYNLTLRLLARSLVHNQLILDGVENNMGLSSKAVSHVVPGDTWLIHNSAFHNAAFPLSLVLQKEREYSALPQWRSSYIILNDIEHTPEYDFAAIKRHLYQDSKQRLTLKDLGQEYTMPLSVNTYFT